MDGADGSEGGTEMTHWGMMQQYYCMADKIFLLKGGRIYDGTASEPFVGDILFQGDRILEVTPYVDTTPHVEADNVQVIDIAGLSVSSGFFDAHSHNDWFAARTQPIKYFEPFIRQGITSFITGNCGLSAVGFEPDTPYVNQIGGGLFCEPGDTTGFYPDAESFFKAIDNNTPCNIALLLGHCTARASVAGDSKRKLTDSEMERMKAILEKGLQQGACGLSLGLMYVPGIYADVPEMRQVAKLCEKYNRPMTVHPRAESKVSMDYPLLGRAHNLRALDELVAVTRDLKIKFQHSHLIFVGRNTFKTKDKAHAILDKMRADGIDAQFDIYNELQGVSVITVIMPAWYQALSPAKKRNWWNKLRFSVLCKATIVLLGLGWEGITIAYVGQGNERWEGKTVPECAKEMGKSCIDAYLDLCEMSGFKGRIIFGPYSTPEIISWQSKQDTCLYMTDAWVEEHGVQNPAIYDCFPKFLRDSLLGVGDTMPRTIRKMTGAVADRFSIKDRGYVKPGYHADFTVFNEDLLKNGTPDCNKAFGIEKVFINGRCVLDADKLDCEALKTTGQAMRSV